MQVLRSSRWLLLAFLALLIPASSYAGVFISVGFAPPPLVTYVQPPCPQPGLIWMPGYWAYGDDGYYWVPGAWVPAPYMGAYWTPGYWGWGGGLYMWHPGYWGPAVGYYGGINYGFGYFGVGFVGGRWMGDRFAYNTAVMRVNTTVIRNVYVDRTVIREHTIVDNHVAYNGGRGGIQYAPSPAERAAMNQPHLQPTRFQQQHIEQAMHDRSQFYRNNHGRPAAVVARQPLPAEHQQPPAMRNGLANSGGRPNEVPNRGGNTYQPNRGFQNPAAPGGRDQNARPNPPQRQYQPQQRQYQPQQQQRQYEPQRQYQQQPRQYQQQQQQRQYQPQQPQRQYQRPEPRPQERPQPRPEERPQARNDGYDRRR
jgi:hypothetical protein